MTGLVTPYSRILLKKPIIPEYVKKFLALHGAHRFEYHVQNSLLLFHADRWTSRQICERVTVSFCKIDSFFMNIHITMAKKT